MGKLLQLHQIFHIRSFSNVMIFVCSLILYVRFKFSTDLFAVYWAMVNSLGTCIADIHIHKVTRLACKSNAYYKRAIILQRKNKMQLLNASVYYNVNGCKFFYQYVLWMSYKILRTSRHVTQ